MTTAAAPKVFLCFDVIHDEAESVRFVSELASSPTAFTVDFASVRDKTPVSDSDKLVRDHVGRCHLLVVLVSETTAAAANVAKEIGYARSLNVPFFGVKVGGAESTPALPAGLAANRTIPYDWPAVASALGQLMKEGKHHVFR